ncbi:MAG: DinB family protein [Chloroflexi bacterium]|nr:DinB family protein [Chloroflexota bacterium]
MTPAQRALRDALAAIPARIRAASSGLVDRDVPPVPGEWSAREVTLHLAAVEAEVWQPRLAALQAEAFPHWAWVEPSTWIGPGGETFEGAVAILAGLRAATVGSLDALDDVGWARRGHHATFGELDVAALLQIALNHDEEHVAQITG